MCIYGMFENYVRLDCFEQDRETFDINVYYKINND